MMQDWRCLQGAVTRLASIVFQPDIACSTDWVWTKKIIFGRSSGETSRYLLMAFGLMEIDSIIIQFEQICAETCHFYI